MNDDKIVSFEAAQDRRFETELEADQAHWTDVRDRLLAVMMASDLQNTALMSATVNALIEALEASGVDINKAKTSIASCVEAMHEAAS